MLNKIIGVFILTLLLSSSINAVDKTDYENIKVINSSKSLIINFNDRLQGVYYKPGSFTGITIITDKQTGREYLYYDETVIELKPQGE